MTEHTTAAEQRHQQALPGSVPAPELRLPLATGEPDQHAHQAPKAPGPDAPRKPVRSTANGPAAAAVLTASPPPTPATVPPGEGISGETDPLVAAVCYQAWGWPVTSRGEQVWLTLEPDTVALSIPILLAAQVIGILPRDCPPLTLIHPQASEHWVILAGGRPEVALPWPRYVHQSTATLALPPTRTAHGLITWVHPPHPDALHHCRELEVFAALRTALRDPPA